MAPGMITLRKQTAKIKTAGHFVRRATPEDARSISALYVRIYTPGHGGDARDYYPFPQILSPDGVAAMIAGDEVVWLVAESPDGTLVGSAGAVRNIGDASDQIGEIFGVVVDADQRRSGLGSALVGGLVDELADASKFILTKASPASDATATPKTYRLDADDSQLTAHVGHKVEVTGTVDAKPAPGDAASPAKLKVASVKMIAASCSE